MPYSRLKTHGVLQALAALFVLAACSHEPTSEAEDRAKIEEVLGKLDQTTLPAQELADLYLDDAVILQPGVPQVRGREEIIALMERQAAGPALQMTHRIDEINALTDIIVVQGGVTGEARPTNGTGPFPFATKNLILFKRDASGQPKIWKVIFNAAPANDSGTTSDD